MSASPLNRRPFAAVIALMGWVGLGTQFDASYALTGGVAETLLAMLRYFTVIVNLLVAILFTAIAFGVPRVASPFRLAGVMIAIMLVDLVYNTLLVGMIELSGGAKVADILNHSVTPILVLLYWLFAAEQSGLKRHDPLLSALLQLAHFGYALARAAIDGIHAYPFMNVARRGWDRHWPTLP